MKTHYRNCNICEAMCGLEIEYEGNEIISIKGDKSDPFSRGHICPKAVALQDFYNDKDRLRNPVKKTKNGFKNIEWEEAFDIVESNIKKIQKKYGYDSVATYLGNPNVHNLGNQLFLPKFIKSLQSKNRYSASSVDQLPHHVASQYMFGHSLLLPVPDLDRTDFLLIIGANPLVSNGSMMTAPDVAKRLKSIQERGGNIIVIDPRKTETAEKADEHFFIKPETDAVLLLAIIHVLFKNEKVNLRHLIGLSDGLDEIKNASQKYTPHYAGKITGIPANKIESLALAFANADRAVCYSRMGASTQSFGGLCLWLTNVLNIISGNFDREGGAMFPQPAFDPVLINSKKGRPERTEIPRSRVRGLPRHYGEFPAATLADEIETAGEGQVKALLTVAGNPVLSTPNGKRLEQSFSKLEFIASIDIYINETTRHADVILPAASGLELPQYDIAFSNLAIRNTAKYAPPLFDKKGNVKDDWQILAGLTARFSGKPLDGNTPEMMLGFALQFGTYGKLGLNLEKLKSSPHGVDLGPMKPCLAERIQTSDNKIRLAPTIFIEDLKRLNQAFEVDEFRWPFKLIGRRVLRQHNTWTHNSPRLSKGKNECTLLMHPEDADQKGFKNRDSVLVKSRTGQVEVVVETTTEIMPGVVSLPQGFGSRKETSMSVAATRNAISINDITDELRVDELTGNAALNGVGVEIEKIINR